MKMTTRSLIGSAAISGLSTLAFAFAPIGSAHAASIGLSNTGSGGYTVSGPTGASTSIIPNGTFPIGPWFDNDATSSWIGSTSANTGNYTYSTTFDLAGLDASTATISGGWAGDNQGVSILLNGVATGITANAGSVNFTGFTAFNIGNTANFQAGLNTLSFTIFNFNDGAIEVNGSFPNPTGLRVAMTGTADAISTEVPEPSEMLGTVLALGSVVLIKRKLTKKKLG